MVNQAMKMHSTSFAVSLAVILLFYSAVAFQTNASDDPKHSGTPNKYASPQLYVFGGWNDAKSGSAKYLSSASHFNSSTGEWKRTNPMSTARYNFCGAVVGTKILLFGGHNGIEAIESAEVYDCETGIHTPYRSMSSLRSGCGAAVLDGFIYVAGGDDTHSNFASMIRYNIQTTRKENVSSMLSARSSLQLVALKGRLYAIGGIIGGKTVEMYNPTTDRWTNVASTHYEHRYFGAAVHEGKIYVRSWNGFEVYSPETDQWEALTSPNHYVGATLVSMNGKLWALGGNSGDTVTVKSVFTFNTSTKKWSEHADMDESRKFLTAFVVNH